MNNNMTKISHKFWKEDDLLKSFPTVKEVVNAIKQLQELCSRGGFNLTKCISNKQEVIKLIPDDKRKPNVRNELVTLGNLPEEKALGVKWDTQNDTLGFYIKFADKPLARRGLVSTLSSVYDPLGLTAPFLLKGRQIIQQLCRSKLNWDEPIDERSSYEWQKWKNNLSMVEEIKIHHCYKPRGFERIINYSLHHFSDASECGYGQATYLRMVNDLEEVHCSLIFGKSGVAPVKYVSTPRLELTAATLSVKISKMLSEKLDIHISSEVFWTDSQVVLGYINNDSRRFKIFVANRVQFIRDNTDIEQWHYISSHDNPADDTSRGLDSKHFGRIKRWFSGPEFLCKETWLGGDNTVRQITHNDPELKNGVRVNLARINDDVISRLESLTLNWMKMKRVMAMIILAKNQWIKKIKKQTSDKQSKLLNVEMLENAATVIFRMIQRKSFLEEVKALSSRTHSSNGVNQSSSLFKLDPFVDSNGVLRVVGRLSRSKLTSNEAHPVVLPKTSNITEAVVIWSHEAVGHGGRGLTLNNLRKNGTWVLSANAVVRRIIHKCVTCRKLRGKLGDQKMSDLAKERCCEAAPFTHCGVDMFGPFTIRERRSDLKQYCA